MTDTFNHSAKTTATETSLAVVCLICDRTAVGELFPITALPVDLQSIIQSNALTDNGNVAATGSDLRPGANELDTPLGAARRGAARHHDRRSRSYRGRSDPQGRRAGHGQTIGSS